jgi:type III pantothenate kinase
MLLAIDIGNTNMSLGVFRQGHLIKRYTIPARERRYSGKLKEIICKNGVKSAIICSVVPDATKVLAKYLRNLLDKEPYILGGNIRVPIKNLYRKPREVGQDRLVNAYAGIKLFGTPLIIVDFGTAITFDIISEKKEYLGGLILPGLNMSLEALAEKTALLPKIKLKSPRELIGRDTESSITSGAVYGFSALTESIIKQIKNKFNKSMRVIGTGGNISFISRHCHLFDRIDPDLTLKGINMVFGKVVNLKEALK